MADVPKETANISAQKIFLPEFKRIKLLGNEIDMKPIPIALAKELRLLSEKLETSLSNLGERPKVSEVTNLDVEAIDLYSSVAQKLLKFYGHDVSIETIEKGANTSDIKSFIQQQINIQGEEDFLVQPLKRIMRIYSSNTTPKTE